MAPPLTTALLTLRTFVADERNALLNDCCDRHPLTGEPDHASLPPDRGFGDRGVRHAPPRRRRGSDRRRDRSAAAADQCRRAAVPQRLAPCGRSAPRGATAGREARHDPHPSRRPSPTSPAKWSTPSSGPAPSSACWGSSSWGSGFAAWRGCRRKGRGGSGDRSMTALITEPGIYASITNEQYHGLGSTPEYALSSSGARKLADACNVLPGGVLARRPAQPELPSGPQEGIRDRQRDAPSGAGAWRASGRRWSSSVRRLQDQACQEMRDGARDDGRILLRPRNSPSSGACATPSSRIRSPGTPSKAATSSRRSSGATPRSASGAAAGRTSGPAQPSYSIDLKSTTSAHPRDFERAVWDYGYHMQADWYFRW